MTINNIFLSDGRSPKRGKATVSSKKIFYTVFRFIKVLMSEDFTLPHYNSDSSIVRFS